MRIYVFYIDSFIESVDIILLDGIHQTNFSYKNTVKKNVGQYSTKKQFVFKKILVQTNMVNWQYRRVFVKKIIDIQSKIF